MMPPADSNAPPASVDASVDTTARETAPEKSTRPRFSLGLDRFSGLYVWAALIIVFAIWVPETFLQSGNISVVAGTSAITAMLAFACLIPLSAGVFDLSFAGVAGVAAAVTVWGQGRGWNAVLAALAACLVAALVGVINGFVVVRLRVSSFIATLGMSSLLVAAEYMITNGQVLSNPSQSFVNLFTAKILGIPLPFYLMLVLGAIVYVVTEYLPVGRYLYATGGNPVAARLAGVRVDRIVFGSLVTSSLIAGVTGVILAAQLGEASPTVGPSYLLPAFSAVFLGSTQIKPGRANVVGTVIAVYLLATGVDGLQLAGAPAYVNDLFNGAALIIAVALAGWESRKA
jgi:ribose transport system permease protein